jgi:hypothetical protein
MLPGNPSTFKVGNRRHYLPIMSRCIQGVHDSDTSMYGFPNHLASPLMAFNCLLVSISSTLHPITEQENKIKTTIID